MTCTASSPLLAHEATAIRAAYAAANAGVTQAAIRLAYTADGWLVTHVGSERWYYAGFELDGTVFLEAFDTAPEYERIAAEAEAESFRRFQASWSSR